MDIDEFLEKCSRGEFEVKFPDEARTVVIDEPILLMSHELAEILLKLPNGPLKVMGSGETVLSVACSYLAYHQNPLREKGLEIEIITDKTMHKCLMEGIQ